MAKWFGKIGYAETKETKPGVWSNEITEREYYGDSIRNTRLLQSSNYVNPNIVVANQISIVSDPYAYQNFHSMRYIEFMGTKWTISNVEDQYPRLLLTIGGVYND